MTKNAFAKKVSQKSGFGILEIIELINAIIPIIQNLPCFKKAQSHADLENNIVAAFRDSRRRKADRIPLKVAAKMRGMGYTSKSVREKLWDDMAEVGFDEARGVASELAIF